MSRNQQDGVAHARIMHPRGRAFIWGDTLPALTPILHGATMTQLEKKLCTAMNGLIVDMIKIEPRLKKPLKRIQSVLQEMGA